MKMILKYAVASRLAIVIIALACIQLAGNVSKSVRGGDRDFYTMEQGDHSYTYIEPRTPLVDMWSVWDTKWYVSIAEDGYSKQSFPFQKIDNKGFLPVYPALLWFFSSLFFFGNVQYAGIALSNLFLVLSLALLRRLMLSESKISEKAHFGDAAWYLLLFPTSYYLSAIYPESLFLLLSIAVFYFSKERRFFAASLALSVALLTKTFGIFLCIPVLFELYAHRKSISLGKLLGYISAGAVLPILYGVYMWIISGDALAYLHIQEKFFRHSWQNPLMTVAKSLSTLTVGSLWACSFFFFGLATLAASYRKIPISYTLYGIVYLLFTPTTGVLEGTSRYLASLFVIPIALASIVKTHEQKNILLMGLTIVQGFSILWWVVGIGFAS